MLEVFCGNFSEDEDIITEGDSSVRFMDNPPFDEGDDFDCNSGDKISDDSLDIFIDDSFVTILASGGKSFEDKDGSSIASGGIPSVKYKSAIYEISCNEDSDFSRSFVSFIKS